MKYFYLLFVILPVFSFSQNLEILVTDIKTNEPLPYANILFRNSGIGASSNMQGYAYFKANELLETDTVIVSYIGYDDQIWTYSRSKVKGLIALQLTPSVQTLSEVVVKYEKPPKPEKVIKMAIKNSSKNYHNQAVIFNSLYRETVNENGNYIQLNEAFVKTHYTGYPQKKLDRKIWEDWFYDETYAFELEGNRFFRLLLKDFNTKGDQQTIVASRHSDDLSKYGIQTTLVGDPLILFAFDKIKYQYDFFNPSLLKKYKFKLESDEFIADELCYAISFYPKSPNDKFSIDQSRKNKYPIYIGKIYISKASFALLKFQYKLAVERDFGFFAKRMPLDYQVEMNYKKQNNFYRIDNIKFSETRRVGRKDNGEAIPHKAPYWLYVLNMETKNVIPLVDSSLFKSTAYSSIRHYKKNYNPKYWDNIQLPDFLLLSPKLIADLEVDKSLPEQFESHRQEQKENLPPPVIFKEPYAFNYHNIPVLDSLHWMALPKYTNRLKKYLVEENQYAKNELVEDKKYQKKLFNRLNTFYPQKAETEREVKKGTYFLGVDSVDNNVLYYQKDSIEKIQVFNFTGFERKHKDIYIKSIIPNDSKSLILVQFEKVGVIGDFAHTLPFGNPTALDSVSNVYTIQWYSDSTFLYTKTNSIGSARELCLHDIGNRKSQVIYTEKDPKFDVEVLKKGQFLFCTVQSKTENEIYWIKKDAILPEMELIKKRKTGVVVDVVTKDAIYLLVNDEDAGSSIELCTTKNLGSSSLFAKSDKDDYIIEILPLNKKVIALVYENSIPKLKYIEQEEQKWNDLKIKLGIGTYQLISADSTSNSFYFSFSSPSHPYARYQYNFNTSQLTAVSKASTINPTYYKYAFAQRIWAKSHDGTKIPITIIKNRATSKSNAGLILKAYGAYGAITTPSFNVQDAILLKEGYTIAYAHVRGESILGPSWYKSGRQLQKQNSILDYISCAEHLIKEKYTSS
ncbi:MAG: carboxypeptidase-like regulatory domain-containing protein, partial [Bacteroidota bacterium]